MAVAALVVDERLLAGGVADVVGGDRRRRPRVAAAASSDVQGVAGVAAGGAHDLLAQLVGELDAPSAASPRRTIASMSAASSGMSSNSWQRLSRAPS